MPTLEEIRWIRTELKATINSRNFPDPVDYIESIRYLPAELTTKPGFYDYDYVPYLKEIVNRFNPLSHVKKIVFMKPAQIAATTGILESIIAYYIGCVPRSMLYGTADKELAETAMATKIERMIDSCNLRDKIFSQTNQNTKKTGDTKTQKEFPGGFLHAIGAKNAAKLRQMSYPVILLDEIDGFPLEVGEEGNPISLAENRSNAYSTKRKILYMSTPTILQTSQIYKLYLSGDQRNYFVPCPRCGELIVMQWHIKGRDGKNAGIQFETYEDILIPESVHYRCQNCSGEIQEKEKSDFLIKGIWKPTSTSTERDLVSYWMDATYSPPSMFSWVDMCYAFIKAFDVKKGKIKDEMLYRSFRNTQQGKPFEILGEALDISKVLIHRRATYSRNQIKNDLADIETGGKIAYLTCTVDVQQKNELLIDIKAWANNTISYTLDFLKIQAEKDIKSFADPCWRELENIIENKTWNSNDGKEYRIGLTLIDAAWGESTDTVYQFCRQYSSNVYPIFGSSNFQKENAGLSYTLLSKSTLEKAGCIGYRVNVNKLKDRVARMLNSSWYSGEKQPMFYLNFPDDLQEDYFMQFTAENKVPVYDSRTNKFKGFEWKIIQGRDNHAFDLAVYHFAAIEMIAEAICKNDLGLESLDWSRFWEYTGRVYD